MFSAHYWVAPTSKSDWHVSGQAEPRLSKSDRRGGSCHWLSTSLCRHSVLILCFTSLLRSTTTKLSILPSLSHMGVIAQWDDFSVSAEQMFLATPLRVCRHLASPSPSFVDEHNDWRTINEQTRISFKYRGKEGMFVVKVTDNQNVCCIPVLLSPRLIISSCQNSHWPLCSLSTDHCL